MVNVCPVTILAVFALNVEKYCDRNVTNSRIRPEISRVFSGMDFAVLQVDNEYKIDC